jgi:diketogulonate reductase-like aldo/keto reductase
MEAVVIAGAVPQEQRRRARLRSGMASFQELGKLQPIYGAARIKPAAIQIEAHPYLPETELLEYCRLKGIVVLVFASLGHGMRPGPLEDPVILSVAAQVAKTPARVLLAWAVQRGTALLTTPGTAAHAHENFNISVLPQGAMNAINRIETRQTLFHEAAERQNQSRSNRRNCGIDSDPWDQARPSRDRLRHTIHAPRL